MRLSYRLQVVSSTRFSILNKSFVLINSLQFPCVFQAQIQGEDLEQYFIIMVYCQDMNKTWFNKTHSNKNFRSCLRLASRRALLAVLLLSIVTPAMAGIAKSSGHMMNMPITMPAENASMEQSTCVAMADMSCHHMGEDTNADMGQALAAAVSVYTSTDISADMDCEQECNCCPGVCSAYLPMGYIPSVFLPEKTVLNKIIINTEAITTATLFRPPITR